MFLYCIQPVNIYICIDDNVGLFLTCVALQLSLSLTCLSFKIGFSRNCRIPDCTDYSCVKSVLLVDE